MATSYYHSSSQDHLPEQQSDPLGTQGTQSVRMDRHLAFFKLLPSSSTPEWIARTLGEQASPS